MSKHRSLGSDLETSTHFKRRLDGRLGLHIAEQFSKLSAGPYDLYRLLHMRSEHLSGRMFGRVCICA